MKFLKRINSGFTLIELLIVISVIGVMVGILVVVVDVQNQRDTAQDAVNLATLEKLAQAIEAFNAAEGRYPDPDDIASGGDGNPLDGGSTDQAALQNYISQWPNGDPGTDDNFKYALPENTVCISVRSLAEEELPAFTVYKYVSPWSSTLTGGRQECGGRIVRCPSPAAECHGGGLDNDLGACEDLEGRAC